MITKEEYIMDPCGTSSLPFWKTKEMKTPNHIHIFHNREVKESIYSKVDCFFKLVYRFSYDFNNNDDSKRIQKEDFDKVVEMINASYKEEDISISTEDIIKWTKRKTYDESLWIKIVENGKIIASGIAEIDKDIREGIIEWVQVLPEYRRKGYGKKIVFGLLSRLQGQVDFVTVSGNFKNKTNPEILYRRCGFIGNSYWKICYD